MIPALAWIIIGGFMEPLWVILLKKMNETHSIMWPIAAAIVIIASPMCLSFAMEGGMAMGVAYSIWTGIGAVFTMIAGVVLYKDKVNRLKILFVMLILFGVVGLQLSTEMGL
jgi:quaternary ammonium compound-resistance protein SugE